MWQNLASRRLKLLFLAVFFCGGVSLAVSAQQPKKEVVLVFPFENEKTEQPEHNWLGESFAVSLSDLFQKSGLAVIANDERAAIYQRLKLAPQSLPSRATIIKVARDNGASLAIIGKYEAIPGDTETPAALRVTARAIRVAEGRLTTETMPDGRQAYYTYDVSGALNELQTLQGRLAYHILSKLVKPFTYTQNQLLNQATETPAAAFDAYVKARQVDPEDFEKREKLLKYALTIYDKERAGAVYPAAAFTLAELYYNRRDWRNAADYFSRLDKETPQYIEAAFKASICYWQLNDLERALASIVPLTTKTQLTSVYNNAGAIALQAARGERDAAVRQELLARGLQLLERGAFYSTDATVQFNYAYGLMLNGNFDQAVIEWRKVLAVSNNDGMAQFLYAKTLAQSTQKDLADLADEKARQQLSGEYARWQQAWEQSGANLQVAIKLQSYNREQPLQARLTDYAAPTRQELDETNLLSKAREFYQAGLNEEALAELRRVLLSEPQNAQAYLLVGLIQQRQGDLEKAVSALKTALFWDSKLAAAHIMLGKIFMGQKDCQQALVYAESALAIEPNNPEAMALKRNLDVNGCR